MKRTVYVLSGPAGIGKSTVGKKLAETLKESAYVSGDDLNHMHVNGRELPWKSEREINLIWENIIAVTKNFLEVGDVVIDYVTFPSRLSWLKEKLQGFDAVIHYVLLWADDSVLKKRDLLREKAHQMKRRSLILKREFEAETPDERYILDTGQNETFDLDALVSIILKEDRFMNTKDNNEEYWRKMYDRFKK